MHKSVTGLVGLSVFSAVMPLAAAELSEVVVTANRLATPLDTTLAATTVITRAQIETLQARSVEDLLRGVDGLTIGNSGGPGKITSFFVRGTDAEHLLVLVDGVRVGSATAGTAALQNLPVEMIDRIEFVRGPRSSLYGSEAIGGVLQIFTRRGGSGLQTDFSASGGSFDTRQIAAGVSGGNKQRWFSVQGSSQSTDGIDACYGNSATFAGCGAEQPDRDGYKYRSLALRAGGEIGDSTQIEVNLLRAPSRPEYDGYSNRSKILQQVAGLGVTHTLAAGNQLSLRVGRTWDESRDFFDGTFRSEFNTRRDNIAAQWDIEFAPGQMFTVGADYLDDQVDSSTDYEVGSRDNKALFLQYVGDHGPWRTEIALRGDDNEQFGRHSTVSAALGYAVSEGLQFVAQYGTAFKAPTFNDLYYPFGYGNPQLDPERSRSLELAVKGRVDSARWRVSLFQTQINDLIGLDINYFPVNTDKARIRGVEASATFPWRDWQLEVGATALDAENRTDDANHGNQLARRPKLAGHLDVARDFGQFQLGARLVTEGGRYDSIANTRRLGGFGTLDLRGEYAFSDAWRVQARVANALDKSYETVGYYHQPGRAAYLTLRYSGAAR